MAEISLLLLMRLFWIGILCALYQATLAQDLAGIATRWDDSFTEWTIYIAEDEYLQGTITMRWPLKGDWTEWDYRLGELSGAIKVKWKDDANLWEVRGQNEIVTIKTIWQNDWRQWEVKSGDLRLDVKSKWSNILEEWSAESSRWGQIQMYTAWEGDLRDWVIEDHLADEVTLPVKIALVFIPVFYSTPKI